MKKFFKITIKLFKEHFHVLVYFYFWLGIFIGGLLAPKDRVLLLDSALITEGWHLSVLSLLLVFPVFIFYYFKVFKSRD
ncbi:MAG: hypothetical protein CMD01_04460 [Flavobacteriales bacterium]|nr:hypothetical protein [Flavobacteriales bacterium]MBG15895.1 hypothetical protein [Crocinitomicaceae bacterium]|tara:strand:+ start:1605 stop:1841 length:237 start_codon:yes stop_codon:yes gene_type:complete